MRKLKYFVSCVAVLIATAGQVQAGVILSDDFDPGIESGNYSVVSNAAALGDGLTGFLSGNALHFGRQSSAIPRLITNALDVSAGGTITFDFRGGNESVDGSTYWEDSDGSNEWADLAYSIDGGSSFIDFQVLNTEQDEGENPTVWNSFSVVIPVAAQTASTQFRWEQRNNSGASFDHWAIDNLSISTDSVVPEPASLALWGLGSLGMGVMVRRRKRKQTELSA